jgi:hypothetical protein
MQSKFKKSYPPVPPGKRLIFRWSHARRRPYPMIVDDTPELQRPRLRKARKARPVRRSRTVKALAVQPLGVTQHPQVTAVTVVPAPTTPRMPHPGSHGDAHDIIGALAGAARALHQVPAGQSAIATFFEGLGGAAGGAGGTRVSAAIGQAMPKEHATITEGLAEKGEAHGPEFVQEARKLADEFGQCAAAETGPNGSILAYVGFRVLEALMHFSAGMVTGAPAGARAHITLVNPTEENVQRFKSSI